MGKKSMFFAALSATTFNNVGIRKHLPLIGYIVLGAIAIYGIVDSISTLNSLDYKRYCIKEELYTILQYSRTHLNLMRLNPLLLNNEIFINAGLINMFYDFTYADAWRIAYECQCTGKEIPGITDNEYKTLYPGLYEILKPYIESEAFIVDMRNDFNTLYNAWSQGKYQTIDSLGSLTYMGETSSTKIPMLTPRKL